MGRLSGLYTRNGHVYGGERVCASRMHMCMRDSVCICTRAAVRGRFGVHMCKHAHKFICEEAREHAHVRDIA